MTSTPWAQARTSTKHPRPPRYCEKCGIVQKVITIDSAEILSAAIETLPRLQSAWNLNVVEMMVEDISKEEYAVLREYATNSENIPRCRTLLEASQAYSRRGPEFLFSTKFSNSIAPADGRIHLHGGVLKEADVCIMNRTVNGPHYRADLWAPLR